jgi:hypothetical protein
MLSVGMLRIALFGHFRQLLTHRTEFINLQSLAAGDFAMVAL